MTRRSSADRLLTCRRYRGILRGTKTKPLTDILERVETWPAHLQHELAAYARELEAGATGEVYDPTPTELAGIGRGLQAAEAGRFASVGDVEAVFAKFRGK